MAALLRSRSNSRGARADYRGSEGCTRLVVSRAVRRVTPATAGTHDCEVNLRREEGPSGGRELVEMTLATTTAVRS